MPDRDKVMTWLEICGKNRDCSGNCPYGDGSGEYEDGQCREDLMADAITLLKEQEAEIEKLTRYINGFSRDAIPVVRCKDCKNIQSDGWCKYYRHSDREDWFCADGERKEGR